MVSGANVMDFRIENVKSTTFGGTRLTRRWIADLQKTVARFPALSRHELASTLCSHLGWFTPKGRDRLGSCRSPVAVSAPEDAWVRLWSWHRRDARGGRPPARAALTAAAARAEHAGGRAVHVPVGVLEGASGDMRPRWPKGGRNAADGARMEEGTG